VGVAAEVLQDLGRPGERGRGIDHPVVSTEQGGNPGAPTRGDRRGAAGALRTPDP
jgi:hypothetical protein